MGNADVKLKTAAISVREALELDQRWDSKQTEPHPLDLDAVILSPEGGDVTPLEDIAHVFATLRPKRAQVTLSKKPHVLIPFTGMPHSLKFAPEAEMVEFTLAGPENLLRDEKALKSAVRVIIVFPSDASKVGWARMNPVAVEVYPPPGVEVVEYKKTHDVYIFEELAPSLKPAEPE
ncbi:hypothetical protein ACFL59_13840 [Planctomycetota bacterium]